MNMPRNLRTFLRDREGAVSVDWVVLAITVIGIVIALLSTVRSHPPEPHSTGVSYRAASTLSFP